MSYEFGASQRENLLSLVSWENLMSQGKSHVFSVLAPPAETISCVLSHERISCLMRNSYVSCFLHKSQKKISWDMRFSHETVDRRFSRGGAVWQNVLSHEKISCLKRKSHVLSVRVPQRENLLSLVSWENLMSEEKISGLISLGPPIRKSPVSCLRRKSHVSRENLMSFHFWVPPTRKSTVSCLLRKSHLSRENLMSY